MAFLTWSFGDKRSYPNSVIRWPDFEYSDRWLIQHEQDFMFDVDQMISKSLPRDATCTNQEAGIYILFKNGFVSYVGQSNRLCHRLGTHSNILLSVEKDFDRYFTIDVPVYFLDDIESIYIRKFNPPDNSARGRSAFKFPKKGKKPVVTTSKNEL